MQDITLFLTSHLGLVPYMETFKSTLALSVKASNYQVYAVNLIWLKL